MKYFKTIDWSVESTIVWGDAPYGGQPFVSGTEEALEGKNLVRPAEKRERPGFRTLVFTSDMLCRSRSLARPRSGQLADFGVFALCRVGVCELL